MKSKTLPLLFVFTAAFSSPAFAQYETVTSTGTAPLAIPIPAGRVVQVFNFTHESDTYAGRLSFTRDSSTVRVCGSNSPGGAENGDYAPELYFAGPGTLTMSGNDSSAKLCLTYKLFDNTNVAPTTPSNAVVIPADAAGPVKVILETSIDLVTWTEALPGTYGSSDSKRFFRVRTVTQ